MARTRILFAGHNLAFLSHVIAHFQENRGYQLDVVTYPGHTIPDREPIQKRLPKTDIVFCEWGLGNLVWFSHHKLPGQTLIARIHAQEFFGKFLPDTDWKSVDTVVFVSEHMKERFLQRFPDHRSKCVVIPNMLDCDSFDRPKRGEAIHQLGLLGALPKSKAPHLALLLLRELKTKDPRYRLLIKGKKPDELDWLAQREDECAYYDHFFKTIEEYGLQDSVVWESFGDDVQEWFTHIGFILSCSDREAFHMSPAEGMASGSIPVIRDWEGSRNIYPGKYIYQDLPDAARMIRSYADPEAFQEEGRIVRQYSRSRFDIRVVLPEYDRLMIHEVDIVKCREEYQGLREKVDRQIKILAAREKEKKDFQDQLQALLEDQKILAKELEESKRRLDEIQSSLSWKVGSALIGKPEKMIRGMRRKKHPP